MRENFPSMRVSVRMYQIACVSRRMRETWKVCFIFIPLALSNSVVKACVFDWDAENLSDHIPVVVCTSLADPGPESEHTL